MISEGADVQGFKVVAVCDCLRSQAENFARELSGGEEWPVYEDFRQMIEKEKLDAVMVETTTHARAWIAIIAMQMGVDVYIEKPISLTIAEGRAMVAAAPNTTASHRWERSNAACLSIIGRATW